ncbi:hypothetical protein LQ764DRAFT_234418 [Zygosaccharomyces rouxii]|nr:hypothetical protein LQ764DRAFT_234418 [Zygosaccharomyces rouxii]
MLEIASHILKIWQTICFFLIALVIGPLILIYTYDILAYLWRLLDYGCRWSIYVGKKSSLSSTPTTTTKPDEPNTDSSIMEHQLEESRESLLNDSPDYHYHSELRSRP